ncbi:response regulator [Novosphingobium sp. JCM 18896]|uniref:response regulator n=1 Tax=Novosphingobium sp. JCM 18896 TaxID=2989731 RepID=UPI002221D6D1|nr:response regulator [Novosphingobium sp. JCM 18896]MCW1432082.1 response regulator [Novosphingobium sp. JCM 18896]
MPAHDPRILILEDEPLIAMELQETLEALGYEVAGPVSNCEAALELIWSDAVDAAVLDLILGEGTCEVVANELSLSGIPWAFASGYDTHELHEQFPEVPIIEKPSRSESVATVVKALLQPSEGKTASS